MNLVKVPPEYHCTLKTFIHAFTCTDTFLDEALTLVSAVHTHTKGMLPAQQNPHNKSTAASSISCTCVDLDNCTYKRTTAGENKVRTSLPSRVSSS